MAGSVAKYQYCNIFSAGLTVRNKKTTELMPGRGLGDSPGLISNVKNVLLIPIHHVNANIILCSTY